jgi:hypothetical protein
MSRPFSPVLFLFALALAHTFQAPARAQGVEWTSVATNGLAGNNQSGSDGVIPARTRISADGRYVVFESHAGNLVCPLIATSSCAIASRARTQW